MHDIQNYWSPKCPYVRQLSDHMLPIISCCWAYQSSIFFFSGRTQSLSTSQEHSGGKTTSTSPSSPLMTLWPNVLAEFSSTNCSWVYICQGWWCVLTDDEWEIFWKSWNEGGHQGKRCDSQVLSCEIIQQFQVDEAFWRLEYDGWVHHQQDEKLCL